MQNASKTNPPILRRGFRLGPILTSLGLYLFIVACLIGLEWSILLTPTTPSGDLAADMLLCNRIRDEGWLLIGHYSRWGFHHPGPFWFWYNYALELLLNWTGMPRFQIWLIGSILINSLFILFSTIAISRYFLNRINIYYAAITAFIFVNFFRIGDLTSSLWMPYRLITPYAALLICFLHIQSGNFKYLVPAALFSMLLINGYVTMPLFTIPFLILCIIVGRFRNKEDTSIKKNKWQILLSIGIIIVFSAPILIDAFYSANSNLHKILAIKSYFKLLPKASWQETNTFCDILFFRRNSLSLIFSMVLLPTILSFSNISNLLKKKISSSLILCLLILLATIVYHKQTPTPLYAYIAIYGISIIALLITTVISPLFSSECSTAKSPVIDITIKFLFILAVILLICLPLRTPKEIGGPYLVNPAIKEFADQIVSDSSGHDVAIDYENDKQWPFVVGLLHELDQRGINTCTTRQVLHHIYTDKMICPLSVKPNYKIVDSTNCGNKCLFEKDSLCLIKLSPP